MTSGTAARSGVRLDQALVDRGLVESRAKAQSLILAGLVFSGDRRLDKAGLRVGEETPLTIKGAPHPWVSRGGIKLEHGLGHFAIDPTGAVCIDVGASTGGFTDVLLAGGAARVYAVDVGHGQLAWKLRKDPRVVVLERTNARHLDRAHVPEPVDLVVCDASFIPLRLVLPAALALTRAQARLVALVKPQFEVGRAQIGKHGVVHEPSARTAACRAVADWLATLPGWKVDGIVESPIRGPEGNVEFLIAAHRGDIADGNGAIN